MRILSGVWAERQLTSPGKTVRPTAEPVRGAVMDVLSPHLRDARVLDLFAGSGALGLEALSRGARFVDFVENGDSALHALKANIARLRASGRTRLFKRDAIPFVDRLDPAAYDVAFADPPYGSRKLDRVVTAWLACPFSAVLCVEHERAHVLPGRAHNLRFGPTSVRLYGLDAGLDPNPRPLAHPEA